MFQRVPNGTYCWLIKVLGNSSLRCGQT